METKVYNQNEYKYLVEDLLNGKVVAFPTETVYGLAIVYDDINAFNRLYQIKNRSITKPISMMVSNKENIEKVAFIDENSNKVIDKFMPGELTLILKAKDNLPEHVTFNLKTVGVRIPKFDLALKILTEVNKPLLVTSANISNTKALVKYEDVIKEFDGKIASLIALDALDSEPSSVVCVFDDDVKMFRQGKISKQEIINVLEERK